MSALFCDLNSRQMALYIRQSERRVLYVAPGIQFQVAQALVQRVKEIRGFEVLVSVDFDEKTLRMGYGSLEAVEFLRASGIDVVQSPGFRSGVLIVDEVGWVFTPTPLYLEAEPQSEETPNAIRLTEGQIHELSLRLSERTRLKLLMNAKNEEERTVINHLHQETGIEPISEEKFNEVEQEIKEAPPVKFDVARQVRVFESYLQYVELSLNGAAIQRNRFQIPDSLQYASSDEEIQGKLKTTFELISKESKLSSKKLEDALNKIRKELTRSLGKEHGRVILKSAKKVFQKELEVFLEKINAHQKDVEEGLNEQLEHSKKLVVDYYLPLVKGNPPRSLIGAGIDVEDSDSIRKWIERQVEEAMPTAKSLIQRMELKVTYKDVTYETLNQKDFLHKIKVAYEDMDWDKVYDEYLAAGEKDDFEQ